MAYTTIKGKAGVRYMLDGKMIKKSSVPRDILIKLDVGMTGIDDKPVEKAPLTCIFCGMGTKITRFINLQSIALCEEHYYSETTGRVVQQLRKVTEHEVQQ